MPCSLQVLPYRQLMSLSSRLLVLLFCLPTGKTADAGRQIGQTVSDPLLGGMKAGRIGSADWDTEIARAKKLQELAVLSRVNCSFRHDLMHDFDLMHGLSPSVPRGASVSRANLHMGGDTRIPRGLSRRALSDKSLTEIMLSRRCCEAVENASKDASEPTLRRSHWMQMPDLGRINISRIKSFEHLLNLSHHFRLPLGFLPGLNASSNLSLVNSNEALLAAEEQEEEPAVGGEGENPVLSWLTQVLRTIEQANPFRAMQTNETNGGQGAEEGQGQGAAEGHEGGVEVNETEAGKAGESLEVAPPEASWYWRLIRRVACCTGAQEADEGAKNAGLLKGKGGDEGKELTGLDAVNDDLVEKILTICSEASWTQISDSDGIKVWRTMLPDSLLVAGRPLGPSAKFYCVMSSGVLDAPPEQVYTYFVDNSRVHEYNEFCKQVKDLEYLDANTKITWSASGRVGPFKERDFVTRVHYRTAPDGSLIIANRAETHPTAPETDRFLRMEIMIGGNVLRPVREEDGSLDHSRTNITVLTHVNPGGIAETRLGTMILNSAAASGPIKFIQGLRQCIVRDRSNSGAALGDREDSKEESEFNRLLREQIQADSVQGRRSRLSTCPAGIT